MLACAASVALPGWTIGSPAVAQESGTIDESPGVAEESGTIDESPGVAQRSQTKPIPSLPLMSWLLYGLDSRFVSPTPAAALGGGGGATAGATGGYASVVDVFVLPVGNADKASIEEIGDLEDVIGIFGPPDQPTRVVDASVQERPAGTTDLLFPGHSGNVVIRALCPAVFSSSSVVWEL
ncbi:unnamed protein product [Closterium sp. Naga37s-1]|nr:unnamed protein product [Closterium sp. Naga37s-1]